MLKKTITYTDFDNNTRTETHYFNMTNNESIEAAFDLIPELDEYESIDENPRQLTSMIVDKMGAGGVFKFIKELILRSYGYKSSDGRRFDKSEELRTEFANSLAFDKIFTDLLSDASEAAEFINEVLPVDAIKEVLKQMDERAASDSEK